jgi:serine/threonine protein kinase
MPVSHDGAPAARGPAVVWRDMGNQRAINSSRPRTSVRSWPRPDREPPCRSLAGSRPSDDVSRLLVCRQIGVNNPDWAAAHPYNPPCLALTPGSRLGAYEVTAQIGEGGMGQVYRARDTRLNRDVALKVLPHLFANDVERLARLTREAQTLASLNHPNIAHIHGLEESQGVRALVMELVEGEDLSQRIARGAIPIDEALPIAKQIAEALEAAQEQGIIHRDLKPANIKVREDGTVKVLDFGLAKALEPAAGSSPSASMSPTITTPAMTQAGTILGTAAYMSQSRRAGRRWTSAATSGHSAASSTRC